MLTLPLKQLLIGSTLYQFTSGFALIFAPRFLSNPLGIPEITGEWEGGPAAVALRPVAGVSYLALGVLSLIPLIRPKERVTRSVIASLAFFHGMVCIPIAIKNKYTISQLPQLVSHALLACAFVWKATWCFEDEW